MESGLEGRFLYLETWVKERKKERKRAVDSRYKYTDKHVIGQVVSMLERKKTLLSREDTSNEREKPPIFALSTFFR